MYKRQIYELNITKNCAASKKTELYFEAMGAKDRPYEEFLRAVASKQLKQEFREGYVRTFTRENVLHQLAMGNNYLQYEFMITENGSDYFWMRIDAYIFYSPADASVHMFTYRKNIDEEKRKELENLRKAATDSMTGAYTREATEQNINWLLAANPNGSYCFFIIDIDNFKQANDLYGHIFGDSCIKQFVQLLKSDCREQDVVGRIGGDEFVLLCPARQPEELAESLAAFCDTIREMGYEVSVGVSESTDRQTLNETVNQAETAMRHDKMEFYRNNGGIRQMRIIDDKLEQLLIKKQDVTRFLQAIAPLYRGVYMVNTKQDTCRYIYVPSYFKTMLENNHHAFMSSVREYCRELVHPEYHDEFAKLLDYSYIEKQIAAHGSLKMTYQIRGGSRVHLKITMADRSSADAHELLWIFLDETQ